MDSSNRKSKIEKEYGFGNMGQRHVQILLLFLAVGIGYGMRAILSIAIVAMVSKNPPDSSIPTYPEWDNAGTILSSFFWGYVMLQVVAGQIAERFGPKYFLASALTLASIATCLIPIMADTFGSTGVIVNRVFQGLCQGFLYPSTHHILSKWTPLSERSRIASFVYFAGSFGTAVSMILSGAICETKLGWPYVFYLYGGIGFAWVALFLWLGSNSPAEHKSISFQEKRYIEQTTVIRNDNKTPSRTPWTAMFTSVSFISIIVSHVGNSWGYWTLLTEIPTYMSSVLQYDIKENSILSALPYFIYSIFGIFVGPLSDAIITKNVLSLGTSRKLFNSSGFLFPALFLIILCFAPKNESTIHVVLLVLAVSTNAGVLAGFYVNHIDISPNFAGTLMGITNGLANIASIIAPLLVQFIVTDEKNESQWKIVFLIAAGMYIFATIFFVLCSSGEIQPWNFPLDSDKKDNSTSPPDRRVPHMSA